MPPINSARAVLTLLIKRFRETEIAPLARRIEAIEQRQHVEERLARLLASQVVVSSGPPPFCREPPPETRCGLEFNVQTPRSPTRRATR
jgi:hypothetical protein